MEIVLYKTSSYYKKLNKVITNPISINGHLKSGCDILAPTFIVKYDDRLLTYNYCYIQKFNRFYFVKPVVNGDTIELVMNVDVLVSHKTNILNSFATVTRSQSGNVFLNDNRIVNTAQHTISHRQIGTGFSGNDCYTLIVSAHGE